MALWSVALGVLVLEGGMLPPTDMPSLWALHVSESVGKERIYNVDWGDYYSVTWGCRVVDWVTTLQLR